MKYTPLVSIIIPVYNGTNFMREAIDSALAQTYQNLEIIVINDGSTDNGATEAAAIAYGDKIRYELKSNGGVSSALNMAVKLSHGEYISWLSHDDLYKPEKIEKEVRFLNQIIEKDKSIDSQKIVIHCATESIDRDGKIIKIPSYDGVDEYEDNLKVILDNVYRYRLSGCSFLIPKDAFRDIGGFREDIRTVSDVEYWYRLLFHGYHFYCLINERLVQNRSHGKQVGKTKVELFERELNELHITIAGRLFSSDYYSVRNMERLYYGLISRKMKTAAIYTKEHYLRGKITPCKFYIGLPLVTLWWSARGEAINAARIIYRRILVK